MAQRADDRRKTLILLFWLLFLTFGYFFQSGAWNENCRLDQTRAIVELGQVHIDPYSSNSGDVVTYHGKVYPAKAPGTSLLAVPAWWLFTQAFYVFDLPETLKLHLVSYFTIWTTLGLASALACILLFLVLEHVGGNSRIALFLTLAYAFGTIALPFSTLFFGHQLAAAFLWSAFALVFLWKEKWQKKPPIRAPWLLFWSGLLAGYGLVIEYPMMLAVIPLCLYVLWTAPRKKDVWPFFIGVGVGGFFLVIYNLWAFRKIYFIPYSILAQEKDSAFPDHRLGFLGIQLPNFSVLFKLTFGATRGLFYCNPWLLLTLPGLVSPFYFKRWRAEMLYAAYLFIALFFMNAGYGTSMTYWGGGSSIGPRHVIPSLPFAVMLIAPWLALRTVRYLFYPLALVSVAIMLMATAVDPRVSALIENPLKDLFIPSYLKSDLAIWPWGIFNNIPLTQNSVSFNFGKLIRLAPSLQLLPLFALWFSSFSHLMICTAPAGKDRTRKAALWTVGCFLAVLFWGPLVNQMTLNRTQGLEARYVKATSEMSDDQKPFPEVEVFLHRVDSHINFSEQGREMGVRAPFAAEWRGFLIIDNPGDYQFVLLSDEPASLYIDQTTLFEKQATPAVTHPQSMTLTRGLHEVLLRYTNQSGASQLVLQWIPPGQRLATMPPSVFSTRYDQRLVKP